MSKNILAIGNTGSAFVNNINANFTELYTRNINVLDYGADPTGVADSTSAIQAAIDAAELVKGKVYIPVGNYKLTDTLVISDGISFEGENVGSIVISYLPNISPYLTGSVLVMTTANKDVILITASKKSVSLSNFGIKFDDAISFLNTGNGITCLAANDGTGKPAMSIQDSVWNNIKVFGTDSNHYSFSLTNIYLNTMSHLRSYGGGGFDIFANNNSLGIGNNIFIDTYAIIASDGTSHGYYLRGTDDTNGNNYLNTFIRMQSNIISSYSTPPATVKGLSAPNVNQYSLYVNEFNSFLNIYSPDFEGLSGGGVYISPLLLDLNINPGLGLNGRSSYKHNFIGRNPITFKANTLTSLEDGSFEYDGVHLYFTIGATRNTII